MLELRTIGECRVVLPGGEIGPSTRYPFALLLYLATERGRWAPRPAIQRLLFAGADAASANHRLRQLVYKLRAEVAAPIESTSDGLRLQASVVSDDVTSLLAADADALLARLPLGEFLPGYEPRFSAPFAEWVEQQRGHVHTQLRRRLSEVLARLQAQGAWERAEPVARACLALDPLNEQATLILAEVLALGGARTEAVRLLDDYLSEVDGTSRELARPAAALRRRIAERLPARSYVAGEATFRGRGEEMKELRGVLTRAAQGHGCSCLIWGEPGIGKSRLVSEFTQVATVEGARVEIAGCQPHDSRRPMGAFSDLVPRLLKLPGALGCSPEAMRFLDRLVRVKTDPGDVLSDAERDPEYLSARITRAIGELLDALTDEATLVIVVEDIHWLDPLSLQVFDDLMSERSDRRLVLVLTSRERTVSPVTEHARVLRLQPLPVAESEAIFREELKRADLAVETGFLEWCLEIAAGNPYFVRELSRHYVTTRTPYKVPGTLQELLSRRMELIDARALRVLQTIAVLGKHATFERVETMLGMERVEYYAVLQRLEEGGLLRATSEALVVGHALVADAALKRASALVLKVLHRHAAELLEKEEDRDGTLAWECALHWERAGAPRRALACLRTCAAHYLSVGRPDQAIEALEGARKLAQDVDDKLAVLGELAEASASAVRWDEMNSALDAWHDLAQRVEPPPPTPATHLVLRLSGALALEADLTSCDAAIAQLLAHDSISMKLRLRLLSMRLRLADRNLDLKLAGDVIRCLELIDAVDEPELTTIALQAQIFYHATFGSIDKAVSIAHRVIATARGGNDAGERVRAFGNAGTALAFGGYVAEAEQTFRENLAFARDMGLQPVHAHCLSQMAWICILGNRMCEAAEWHREAQSVIAGRRGWHGMLLHTSNAIELAISRRNATAARAALATARELCPSVRAGRDYYTSLAFEGRISQLANRQVPDTIFRQLCAQSEKACKFAWQDITVEVLARELDARGDRQRAAVLVDEYVTSLRRERFALPRDLADVRTRLFAGGNPP